MSIIYEALKKLERTKKHKYQSQEAEKGFQQGKDSKKIRLGILTLLSLLIFSLMITLAIVKVKHTPDLRSIEEKKTLSNLVPSSEGKAKDLPSEDKIVGLSSPLTKITPLNKKTLLSPSIKMPPMKLEGIIYSETNPIAIIDKKFYLEGESYKGCKIISISKDFIEVEFRGRVVKVEIQ